MDAYFLLLGRLWLFNRKVSHDGYKKMYDFDKDGIRVTLRPCKNEWTSEPNKGEDKVFLSMANIELEVEEASQACTHWKSNHQVAQATFSLELH